MSVQTPRRHSPAARLAGLDLFRAVAVFGMLVAHVGPAAWTPGETFGTVHWEWELFHSRMPAMFAFAAGLSLNLGGRPVPDSVQPATLPTLIRALLLALCGALLVALGTPVVVILPYFAVWFALVLPFRRLGARALLITAGAWAIAGPLLSLLLRRSLHRPDSLLTEALIWGDYPALTWMPFVLAGLAVGRMRLGSARVRARLVGAGIALVALGYALPGLLLGRTLTTDIMASLTHADGRNTMQEFSRLFFRESGVVDPGHAAWLLLPAPHSGSWADVIGCLGVCLLLLGVLLPLGDAVRWANPAEPPVRRAAAALVRSIAPLGAMVLSVYALHIVAMAAITAATGHSFRGPQSALMLIAFSLGLAIFSAVWLRRFRRGPLETALASSGRVIERTGRRVCAGWWRRSRP